MNKSGLGLYAIKLICIDNSYKWYQRKNNLELYKIYNIEIDTYNNNSCVVEIIKNGQYIGEWHKLSRFKTISEVRNKRLNEIGI